MFKEIGINAAWKCYDITPVNGALNAAPEFKVIKRDTLTNFPKGYKVCVTNPPYLAKNSATRSKIDFPISEYDDLYKISIDTILNNTDYAAAIIPDSYINANLFHDRLYTYISLTCKMFEDTECPVCLALFVPSSLKTSLGLAKDDFYVYNKNKKLGKYSTIIKKKPKTKINHLWKINDKTGNIGIYCADNNKEPSIKFVKGDDIDANLIKTTSRNITRISGLPTSINLNIFLSNCNTKLNQYRVDTNDVFLTAFKGLRKDGNYRRRLDFANAKLIMNSVLEDMGYEGGVKNNA